MSGAISSGLARRPTSSDRVRPRSGRSTCTGAAPDAAAVDILRRAPAVRTDRVTEQLVAHDHDTRQRIGGGSTPERALRLRQVRRVGAAEPGDRVDQRFGRLEVGQGADPRRLRPLDTVAAERAIARGGRRGRPPGSRRPDGRRLADGSGSSRGAPRRRPRPRAGPIGARTSRMSAAAPRPTSTNTIGSANA